MNIGIFGGTFDPVHNGHLSIIDKCAQSGFFEKIYIIPSYNPPHKSRGNLSLFTYRFEMVKAALKNIKSSFSLILSDIETEEDGFSYTLNTVRKLNKEILKNKNLYLICGSDVLYDVNKWHKPDLLLKEIGLYVFIRPGYKDSNLQKHIKYVQETYDAKVVFADSQMPDIASNQIRDLLYQNNNEVRNYLPENVYNFVFNNKIYDTNYLLNKVSAETLLKITEYEKKLRTLLTPKRLLHSLNTMREAVRLSVIFGADPDKCAIAGILHDCAKYNGADKVFYQISQTDKNITAYESKCEIPEKILHAYWGRDFVNKIYGITDIEISDAVYYHTTSRANPTLIEKIVFVADKIEPARNFPRIDKIRQIAYDNLDDGYYECLKDIIKVLENSKSPMHCDTLNAYEFIKNMKFERRD